MQSLFFKLRTWWETADRTQKTVSIFGSAFLVILLIGTYYFASKPKMDVLFRNLTPQDQGMVAAEITKLNIPFEQDRSGTILVPTDKIAEIQGKLAVSQKLPSSGHSGYTDLDKLNPMVTPSVEREKLKGALEGELARSVESITGVKSARVHLSLGDQSPFATEKAQASASAIISEVSEGTVGREQARAIQRLIQFAVPDLPARNITIVNSTGRTLIDGSADGGSDGATERLAAENSEAKRRESMLQARLDMVFGKGNTVVSIPVLELNLDTRDAHTEETVPTKPISSEKVTETMNQGSNSSGGPAGTASNTATGGAPASASTENKGYTSTQEAKEMATSTTKTNTNYAPGNLKKMALNVLVNSTIIKDEGTVKQALKGELGPLATDTTNFTFTVTSLPFDTKATDDMKKSEAASAGAASKQQMMSFLPIIALIVVGVMVMKSLAKAAKNGNTLVAALPGGQMLTLGGGSQEQVYINMDGNKVAVAAGSKQALDAAAKGQVVGLVEQRIRGGEGSIINDPNASTEDKARAIAEFVESDSPLLIAKIPDHVNVPLEQVKRLSKDRPDMVAMLLKTWILSDTK